MPQLARVRNGSKIGTQKTKKALPPIHAFPALFAQRIVDLIIDQLVGAVAIVGENVDAPALVKLQNGGGAAGASALAVFALAENVQAVLKRRFDELGKVVRLRKVGVLRQMKLRQHGQINIPQWNVESPFRFPSVIQPVGGVWRVVKADDRRVFGESLRQQLLGIFTGTNCKIHSFLLWFR